MHQHWQDLVLSICILGFNVALIPTLLSRHKPHASTGVMTAAFQLAGFTVYVSLHLWYSASMSLLNAFLWSVIVFQKVSEPKKRPKRR